MILRWLVLLGWLGAGGIVAAARGQEAPASAVGDERTARIVERYKSMLAGNPVEGIALDRLWKSAEDRGATGALLDEYARAAADVTKPAKERFAAALVDGHLLKRAGRLDEAEAAYKLAAGFDSGSPLPPLAMAELANARNKPGDAAGFFETALAKLPRDDRRQTDLLFKLGAARLAAGQAPQAAESWEKIIALDPGNVALRRQLAETYEKNHLPDRAIGHYQYIDQHAEPAERALALRELARLQQAKGDFDAARDALEHGLGLMARDHWLHGDLQGRLIRLYQRAGRAPELEARWKAAVDQNPRDLGGYLRLVALAEAQADPAARRLWLEKIVALAPGDRDSALQLARLLADSGEREPAASLYDGLLKIRPGDLDLIFARAELDLQLDRPKAAVERIESRLAQAKGDESTGAAALEFFLSHHLDEAAERWLRTEAARQPVAEEPALALAKFLFAQQRPAEARAALEALVAPSQKPGVASDPAARAARLGRVAEIYKAQNLNEDALRCWRIAEELQPKTAAPLLAQAELLLNRGDKITAAQVIGRAAESLADGPEKVDADRRFFQVIQGLAGNLPTEAIFGKSPPIEPEPDHRAAAVKGTDFALAPDVEQRMKKAMADAEKEGRASVAMPEWALPPGSSAVDRLTLLRDSGGTIKLHASPRAMPGKAENGALARRIVLLAQAAQERPTAERFLRLARWQSWANAPLPAAEAARRAIASEPGNLPARELLVTLTSERGQREEAVRYLREIIEIDPARKGACLKQIGTLKLDDGDAEAAVAIFQELEHAASGSPAALSDLALALQRAERWSDALAVWERAYALPSATAQQRADIRRPLVTALERLELFSRVMDVLFAAVDAQPDLSAKQELFGDLIAFCRKRQLMTQLQTRCEERLAAQPQDYFLLTALADFRRASGREREAYELLGQAYYSSPDPARSLRALVEGAETLGDLDAAISHQRRLVAMARQNNAENLEKLAALETANFDPDAAARTWEQIAGKFPRDPDALGRAEEFFEKAARTDRARALLEQITALDPTDLKKWMRLGQLDVQAGDGSGARAAFEQVLTRAEAEKPADPPQPPPAGLEEPAVAVEARYAGRAAPGRGFRAPEPGLARMGPPPPPGAGSAPGPGLENPERRMRLEAIREISRLLFPPSAAGETAAKTKVPASAPAQWLDRWRKAAEEGGARNEPLWAFYYSGQKTPAMDHLTRWLSEHPDDERIQKAFLNAGLRLGEYKRVARWVWEADPKQGAARPQRAERLLGAMTQFLAADGAPGARMAAELFPPEVCSREALWTAASEVFAPRQRYADAVELGSRAFKLAQNDQPDYALELSHWNLFLGRADAAREALRSAIELGSADSLEGSGVELFAAVREYWLLLPQGERAAFIEAYLRTHSRDGGPAQGVLAAALLHGLSGDEEAARRDLDALLALRMLSNDVRGTSADPRRWIYLLANGAQLREWGLYSMAGYLWRRALGEAGAQVRQDEESRNVLGEMRSRLAGLEIETAASPQQVRERIDEFLRSQPEPESAATLAARLMSTQPTASARIFESLCRTNPEGNHWRNLLNAYDAAGDRAGAERLLRGDKGGLAIGAAAGPLDEANSLELTRRRVALLTADSDGPGARRLMESWLGHGLYALPLGFQLARSYEQAGKPEEAERVWRELLPNDPNSGVRLALAAIEENRHPASEVPALLLGSAIDAAAIEESREPRRKAIALLEYCVTNAVSRKMDSSRIEVAGRLAGLYLAVDEADKARALAVDLLAKGPLDTMPAVAAVFAKAGHRQAAREFLMVAVRRTRDAQERFRLQSALLEYCEEPSVFQRETRRLATFAEGNPSLRAVFEEARFEQARKHGLDAWLEGELKREWNGGKGGPFVGDKLIRLYRLTGRAAPLRETVEAFARQPGAAEPSLFALQEVLANSGHADLAEPIAQRLRRRYPQNPLYTLASAQALWQCGRKAEVALLLDAWETTSVFQENVSESIAQKWVEFGESARAEAVCRRMAARDPMAVKSPMSHLYLARAELTNKNLPAARQWLRAAYRNAACADLEPLADYLVATGQWDDARRALAGDMPLTMERRGQLALILWSRLNAAGKNEAAQRLAMSHPELLAATPELAARLRERTAPAQREEAAAALENAAAQSDPPPRLMREMAAFYAQWAGDELTPAAPGTIRATDAALTHLTRAHQLLPEDFTIARRLAELYLEKKQNARAAEVLQTFLAPDALPAEREQARKLLKMKAEEG